MKTYNDIKDGINTEGKGNLHLEGATLRCNYLKEIASITQRNVIAYYSSYLDEPDNVSSEIGDEDIVGFVNAVSNMDTSVGLDLIIHSPGGSVEAAEAIIKYLHSKFNDIRVIVPFCAYSAATLIAASSNCIIMGDESYLGPTDPQYFMGISAYDVLEEFKEAEQEISKDPSKKEYYQMRLKGLPVGFPSYVKNSIKTVKSDLKEWLNSYMFKDMPSGPKKDKTVNKIVNTLVDPKKSHSYHYSEKECQDMGLKVIRLEDIEGGKLYQNVIYLHYLYLLSFQDGKPGKLIEAYNDTSYFVKAKERVK